MKHDYRTIAELQLAFGGSRREGFEFEDWDLSVWTVRVHPLPQGNQAFSHSPNMLMKCIIGKE